MLLRVASHGSSFFGELRASASRRIAAIFSAAPSGSGGGVCRARISRSLARMRSVVGLAPGCFPHVPRLAVHQRRIPDLGTSALGRHVLRHELAARPHQVDRVERMPRMHRQDHDSNLLPKTESNI